MKINENYAAPVLMFKLNQLCCRLGVVVVMATGGGGGRGGIVGTTHWDILWILWAVYPSHVVLDSSAQSNRLLLCFPTPPTLILATYVFAH